MKFLVVPLMLFAMVTVTACTNESMLHRLGIKRDAMEDWEDIAIARMKAQFPRQYPPAGWSEKAWRKKRLENIRRPFTTTPAARLTDLVTIFVGPNIQTGDLEITFVDVHERRWILSVEGKLSQHSATTWLGESGSSTPAPLITEGGGPVYQLTLVPVMSGTYRLE